jgi:hypothetical protein
VLHLHGACGCRHLLQSPYHSKLLLSLDRLRGELSSWSKRRVMLLIEES